MSLKIALLELERRVADLEADLQPPLGKPGGVLHTTQRIDEALPEGPKEQEMIETVNKGLGISNQDARIVYRFDDCNPVLSGTTIFKGFCVSSHGQFRMDQRGISVRKVQEFFFNLEQYMNRNQTNRLAFDLISAVHNGYETKWTDERSSGLTIVFKREGDSAKIITAYFKNKKDPILVKQPEYSYSYSRQKRRRRR
jgi:hypothetical protein